MTQRYAVIMAGGKGERFWPLSTSKHPKQLLNLIGEKPLIAQAVERLEGLLPLNHIYIVTNADLLEATRKALPTLPTQNIVGEPIGRDTAAAVACSAALIKAQDPNAVFAILTADHVMGQIDQFKTTLHAAMKCAAQNDVLLTIGIKPTEPATGFGYIKINKKIETIDGVNFFTVQKFVEKPNLETAKSYLSTGGFYWNSGMFIWSVSSIYNAFLAHDPDRATLMDTLTPYAQNGKIDEGMALTYPTLEKISIDYALMEKAKNIIVAAGTFTWDDVGSWPALENQFPQDQQNNTAIGDVELIHCSNNLIYSKNHLTALIGVENLIVVQAEGVTLICPKDQAQNIKQLLANLRTSNQHTHLL